MRKLSEYETSYSETLGDDVVFYYTAYCNILQYQWFGHVFSLWNDLSTKQLSNVIQKALTAHPNSESSSPLGTWVKEKYSTMSLVL